MAAYLKESIAIEQIHLGHLKMSNYSDFFNCNSIPRGLNANLLSLLISESVRLLE